jgi:hypothetical protein
VIGRSFCQPRWIGAIAALAFLAGHLPFLAPSLEDIDSVNFALALRDFDVAAHRPHPPGYPVFVAAGKIVRVALAGLLPASAPPGAVDARALALVGVLAGALMAWPLLQFFRMLETDERRAGAALLLALSCPLLWFTASRPLSDVAGLASAAAAMALLATAYRRQRSARGTDPPDPANLVASGRLIVLGALVAGAAVGMRSQTLWLTLPLLGLVIADRAGRGAAGAILGAGITFGIGAAVWAVPLVVLTGGPARYLAALTSQAGEDLAGVDMLATRPSARSLAFALVHTFVDPWANVGLAAAVLALAGLGALVLLLRHREAAALLAAVTVPYGLFHLAFHETVTTRYALPLVPAIAYCAVRGLAALGPRLVWPGAALLAASGLAVTVPPLWAYGRTGSPLARAAEEVEQYVRQRGSVVGMHHAFALALRGDPIAARALPSPPKREWEELRRYWLAGGPGPVQFLADPRRTDLAAFDPASRRLRARYRWPFDPSRLLGGVRPGDLDWIELSEPGWIAGPGSALTPELAGLSALDRQGPALGGLVVHARRRPEAAVIFVGGRNLGRPGDPDVAFSLLLDGRLVRTWVVPVEPAFFLETWSLPAGALDGAGPFAEITIRAAAASGASTPVRASVEQFDLQPAAAVVFGYGRGWHEPELAPATGRSWRWSSESADLVVHHAGRDVRVRIRGESPLRYFDEPPVVRLLAGGAPLGEWHPSDDFAWEVAVPAAAIDRAGGTLTLTTSQTFVPAAREGGGDRRRLGLRVYGVEIVPAPSVPR